jgi:hypothetical protein
LHGEGNDDSYGRDDERGDGAFGCRSRRALVSEQGNEAIRERSR